MVELQIINKLISAKNTRLLDTNNITRDYFSEYLDEYDWIMEHRDTYGNIPDIETFLAKFQEFDVLNVGESDEYLIHTIREEHLYAQSVPVITKLAELLQTDSYQAVEYLKASVPLLKVEEPIKGIDIIAKAKDRYEEWLETKNNKDAHFMETGFKELDDDIGGFHRGEELVVVFARTGQGKSWVVIKMLEHSWNMKFRVGMLEPEMSANKTGYRFDTLHQHISSSALYRGSDIQGYEQYINRLQKTDVPFYVSHPKDFSKQVTVSKLRSWVESNNLDILCIDGISYMVDERGRRGDNKTISLTNISEDLMQLSIDLKIPVIVVVQSNRGGTMMEDLQLENIRDSDGIAYNASLVISVQQKETGLQLVTNKVRNGKAGTKLTYIWDADKGTFEYIPQPANNSNDIEKAEDLRRQFNDKIEEEEY